MKAVNTFTPYLSMKRTAVILFSLCQFSRHIEFCFVTKIFNCCRKMPLEKDIHCTSRRLLQAFIIHHHGACLAKHYRVVPKQTMCPTVTTAKVAMARWCYFCRIWTALGTISLPGQWCAAVKMAHGHNWTYAQMLYEHRFPASCSIFFFLYSAVKWNQH